MLQSFLLLRLLFYAVKDLPSNLLLVSKLWFFSWCIINCGFKITFVCVWFLPVGLGHSSILFSVWSSKFLVYLSDNYFIFCCSWVSNFNCFLFLYDDKLQFCYFFPPITAFLFPILLMLWMPRSFSCVFMKPFISVSGSLGEFSGCTCKDSIIPHASCL